MNTETGWIAMTTRKPTEEDLPVVAGSYRDGKWTVSSEWDRLNVWDADRTHWYSVPPRPALPPCPPLKPPTQREADEAAYSLWYCSPLSTRYSDAREMAWHSALAYERAAILALTYQRGHPGMSCSAAMDRIQERCAP